jgi:hypothetical protein
MELFTELGHLVERRWSDKNYNEAAFPEIAAQALAETRPTERVDPLEIIRHLHSSLSAPAQHGENFSDLPITLYAGPRFYVDVYFWLDGTTAIHQHGFSGAFQVLSGSSIHSLYTFTREQEINPHFSTGQLLLEEVQVLGKGDIRKILPGDQFIHSLFHLERPSVTITVRTVQSPGSLPQFSYLKPHFAHDPFFREQLTFKKLASVNMLLRLKHPAARPIIGELISSSDLQTTFLILTTVFEHLSGGAGGRDFALQAGQESPEDDRGEWEDFYQLFRKSYRRHGSAVNLLFPVLGEMQRQTELTALRKSLIGSDHRFFLALLLNAPHRTIVLDLVRQRFPQRDPAATVCEWVRQFSAMRHATSPGQNILGIDNFSENHLLVLRRLLEGASVEQIKDDLEGHHPAGKVTEEAGVDGLYLSLQNSTLIKSLLP